MLQDVQMLDQEIIQNRSISNIINAKKRMLLKQIQRIEDDTMINLLKEYKIVATTIGMVCSKAIRSLNFNLVVVDEAFSGHLCHILDAVCKAKKQVVLAYDIHQLGRKKHLH